MAGNFFIRWLNDQLLKEDPACIMNDKPMQETVVNA
jgi:hypothetical protein